MKKILFSMIMLLAFTGHHVEAKTSLKIPDIKNAAVIKALKTGTYDVNGIKLGDKEKLTVKKWGKPTEHYKRYADYYNTVNRYMNDQETIIMASYDGKAGQKLSDYPLTNINFNDWSMTFTTKQMKKYWGNYDMKYIAGMEKHYMYGHTVLSFTREGNSLTNIWYADSAHIKQKKIDYAQ